MRKVLRLAAVLVLLGLLLVSCDGTNPLLVDPQAAQLCGGGVVLSLDLESLPVPLAASPSSPRPSVPEQPSGLQWYRDGQPIAGADWITYTATVPGVYSYTLTACGSIVYDGAVHGQTPVGRQQECYTFASQAAVIAPCGPDRADVSVIIYGGWDGIPVQAWVGGSPQETMYSALDGSGLAAVLWTFYPPGDGSWRVSVAPQLPAGLDGARWKYRLVRVVAGGSEVAGPSADIAIVPGQYVFYFQLVDEGAPKP